MLILQEGKQVTDLIFDAKNIAVSVAQNSGMDGFCAGVGLYKALRNAGKNVSFLYPYQIDEGLKDLISRDEITQVRGTRDLVVSVDFGGTSIEKINYFVEGNVCNIVLHPVSKNFNSDKVKFSTGGFNYDLMISVGAQRLSDHEILFNEFEDELKKIAVINVDNSNKNENFATINVVEPDSESLCQLVLYKLASWHYKVDKEVAKALLTGISDKSENLENKSHNQDRTR